MCFYKEVKQDDKMTWCLNDSMNFGVYFSNVTSTGASVEGYMKV